MIRRKRSRSIKPKKTAKKPPTPFILLDKFSADDIQNWTALKDKYLKYHWDFYNELAYQRFKIADKIRESLIEASQKSFEIEKWQRAVKYKYALEPLAVTGSLKDPGGRFNIGDINASQFPPFPALYLAADKQTAMQELLSQDVGSRQKASKLDPMDFALTRHDSIAIASVSGSLGSVINLKSPKGLRPFIDLIKDFSIPDYLEKAAEDIGERRPELITTVPKLIDAVLIPDWRLLPMQFDVPSSSQIFGQLVAEAGIEGIVYASKFSGGDCLAIFPQNFDNDSFIQLNGKVPEEIKMHRLDAETWRKQY